MKIQIYALLAIIIFASSCQTDKESKPTTPQIKMVATHYYSIKMENGKAIRDTLKECSYCNQADVFDKNGKEIEHHFYKTNMKDKYAYEIFQHNSNGHKIGSAYYDNDTLITKYEYQLDDKNRIASAKAIDVKTNKMIYGYQNKFDDKGNHYESGSLNSKGELTEFYRRKFNGNGIATSENIEDLDGNPTFRIRYEYRPQADSSWIEQLTYYNDVLKEIRVRKNITY